MEDSYTATCIFSMLRTVPVSNFSQARHLANEALRSSPWDLLRVEVVFIKVVFENGLNWKKWIGIIVDLIDVKKKVRIFCIKK
jgi:hypothetical protein